MGFWMLNMWARARRSMQRQENIGQRTVSFSPIYTLYNLNQQAKIQLNIENLLNPKFYAGGAAKERSYMLSVKYMF